MKSAIGWESRVALATLIVALSFGSANLVQGALVGEWTFNDGTANDTSGLGHHGTLAGTAAIVLDSDPARGMVYSGDGMDSKIDLGNPATMNIVGELSVTAWVKPNILPQNQGNAGILQRGHQTGGTFAQREFVLRTGVNTATSSSYQFGTWSPNMHTTFEAPVEDVGTWVHLAGTMTDAGGGLFTYRLFRNGEEVAMLEGGPGMLSDYEVGWAIGARGGVTDQQREWNGFIDDMRLYDHALSIDEILADMIGGVPGDVDGDEDVDMADYFIIRDAFQSAVGSREEGDLNRDGIVNLNDFAQWKSNFPTAAPEPGLGTAVPEPSTGLLLACGALALLSGCRSRRAAA